MPRTLTAAFNSNPTICQTRATFAPGGSENGYTPEDVLRKDCVVN
jgi:hypothetical protein